MIKSGNNIIKVFPKILKFPLTIMIFISCAARIDHFGNDVNLGDDRIYLSKIRKDTKDRDKYYLTFVVDVFGPLNAHNSAHIYSPELISKLVISELSALSFDSNEHICLI